MENKVADDGITGVVYGLFCPISKELRYIGSTYKSPSIRLKEHKKTSCVKQHGEWISYLRESGQLDNIKVEIIESNIPLCDLRIKEHLWIRQFSLMGCNLTNSYHYVSTASINKDKNARGEGVPVTVFLSGKYLQVVSAKQAEFQIKNSKRLSREGAILKIMAGE